MTTQELRELDAWIKNNVTHWERCSCVDGVYQKWGRKKYSEIRNSNKHWIENWPEKEPDIKCDHFPHYTSDQAAAMNVLKKCAELQAIGLEIDTRSGIAEVYTTVDPEGLCTKAEAETLELAICLFSKQLFSQITK